MYKAPSIVSGAGIAKTLADLDGHVQVITMDVPWGVFQKQVRWTPDRVHMVSDVGEQTLAHLDGTLPSMDVVVGIGGGSSADTAKYLAWKRGCRMILVPTIISVDAPFTNMIGVRVDNAVKYVGDIWPEEILIDYALIQEAPPELNRAGAADIASIHTALHDWKLANTHAGEAYDKEAANLAEQFLAELDGHAAEIHKVTPKGIDTLVNLFVREAALCARAGTSRPEEGSEHLVAYNMEYITKRHFIHGDLVALGIFLMSRLQQNSPGYAEDLLNRLGLRYDVPGVSPEEIRTCLETLLSFKTAQKQFFSVVDTTPITPKFIEEALDELLA